MNGKMSAVVLVGASLLSSGVMAADPKPEVAAALQQIEARKAEKAAVAARQMKQWAQRERGEDSERGERPVVVKPGGSVYAPGAAAPQGNPAR